MPFVALNSSHVDSLQAMLADFTDAGEPVVPGYFPDRDWTHTRVVATLAARARGEELGAGWVPCTTHFLEVDVELVGLFNLRHELSDGLRKYGGHIGYSVRPSARRRGHARTLCRGAVEEGRKLGIERFFLTCGTGNIGSARAIERCGGVFEAEYWYEPEKKNVRSYWIG